MSDALEELTADLTDSPNDLGGDLEDLNFAVAESKRRGVRALPAKYRFRETPPNQAVLMRWAGAYALLLGFYLAPIVLPFLFELLITSDEFRERIFIEVTLSVSFFIPWLMIWVVSLIGFGWRIKRLGVLLTCLIHLGAFIALTGLGLMTAFSVIRYVTFDTSNTMEMTRGPLHIMEVSMAMVAVGWGPLVLFVGMKSSEVGDQLLSKGVRYSAQILWIVGLIGGICSVVVLVCHGLDSMIGSNLMSTGIAIMPGIILLFVLLIMTVIFIWNCIAGIIRCFSVYRRYDEIVSHLGLREMVDQSEGPSTLSLEK